MSDEPVPPLTEGTIIARSRSIIASEVDGEILMMSVDQGRYFVLDDTGKEIWQQLAQPRPLADLTDCVALLYDAPRDEIAADIQAFVTNMVGLGVIVVMG